MVFEAVISASNHTRALCGIQILRYAIVAAKWHAFWASHNDEAKIQIQSMQEACALKIRKDVHNYSKFCTEPQWKCKKCLNNFPYTALKNRFLKILLDLTIRLKHLIIADRENNWEAHLTAVQNLLPVFRSAVSTHYLRYASWYLEKMRIPPTEHPEI